MRELVVLAGPMAISKDADFLRSTHEVFQRLEPTLPPADLVLETSEMSAGEAAARVAELVL